MEIEHVISTRLSEEAVEELAELGVSINDVPGVVNFTIRESDSRWTDVERWIQQRSALDIVRTTFSKEEVRAASWLELVSDWQHGYPQPEERYLAEVYRDGCTRCGCGRVQSAPFQMKKEPRWGRRGILQLHWVFDEFFVRPEIWEGVFRDRGVACRPVVHAQTGTELRTVVQLAVESRVGLRIHGTSRGDECSECGTELRSPIARGRFPRLAAEPEQHVVRTRDLFGSGASFASRVIVSQSIAGALLDLDVVGVSFRPVERGALRLVKGGPS